MIDLRIQIYRDLVHHGGLCLSLDEYMYLVNDIDFQIDKKISFALELYKEFGPLIKQHGYRKEGEYELIRASLVLFSHYLATDNFNGTDIQYRRDLALAVKTNLEELEEEFRFLEVVKDNYRQFLSII